MLISRFILIYIYARIVHLWEERFINKDKDKKSKHPSSRILKPRLIPNEWDGTDKHARYGESHADLL
jgi:hypothetical protein